MTDSLTPNTELCSQNWKKEESPKSTKKSKLEAKPKFNSGKFVSLFLRKLCIHRSNLPSKGNCTSQIDLDDAPVQPTHKLREVPQTKNAVQIRIPVTDQQMYLFPPIEEARFQIMHQLFAWEAMVTSQVRFHSSLSLSSGFRINLLLNTLAQAYETMDGWKNDGSQKLL